MSILRPVALLMLALSCCGCGRSTPKSAEPLAPVHADVEGNVPLPEGFPADVPRYPGARLAAASMIHPDASITLQTSDDVAKVLAYYISELPVQGWGIKSTINVDAAMKLEARKKGLSLDVEIRRTGDLTSIEIKTALPALED